ncbi:MAG: ThuA domain-containing protein [Myxococcota bacterium]
MSDPIRVTVWNENIHEQKNPAVQKIYPDGIHEALAAGLQASLGDAVAVRTATLEQPEHGLTEPVLAETDVLLWWGRLAHHQVENEIVSRVQQRVLDGMGLIVLHSAHLSKIFGRLMGTRCTLRWREGDDREVVWTVAPNHPIARGVNPAIVLERHEMYGEFFDVPPPDEQVFISNFSGGEVFRSGCCWRRGKGRVFYFSPGHETYPIYHHPEIKKVLANAVQWAYEPAPSAIETETCPNAQTGWFE